jgi:hypothetical protein
MSLLAMIRGVGVTQSWFEVVPAVALIAVLVASAIRLGPWLRKVRTKYPAVWPAALGIVVFAGYFVVPNAMSGISGLSQRLPLFAAMLLVPFVPAEGRVARALAFAAVPFGIYVALINAHHERHVSALRAAADAVPIERDDVVYLVTLDVELGTATNDLGRYFGADVARRHDAVTGDLFVGNPVFPLLGTGETPLMADPNPVQSFARMNEAERARALSDPKSPIAGFFEQTLELAARARYIVVIPYPPLEGALNDRVLAKLGARRAPGFSEALPIYELPASEDAVANRKAP